MSALWSFVIFFGLVALVVLDFWWHERRRRRERARAEQEYTAALLREQKRAFAQAQTQRQALFDSMVEGVLLLDREGRIQLANQSLTRLLNVARDVRGHTLAEALRWPALSELAARAAKEKQVLGGELDFPGPEPRCVEVNAAAYVDPDGQPQGTILVFHDVTRLRQLEHTRREFVANVSHELRTPLAMIKGYVETLLDGAKDEPATATRFLQTIARHTDRLTYLIEDLLTISKLESGQLALNSQALCPRDVVQHVFDDLEARAAERRTHLENAVPEKLRVTADTDRLQQVLFNLLENAIKYGRVEGHVRVSGRGADNDTVELSVADDGPGIPAEAQERIFERFFRLDKARSREAGGTGLGLAIVKHIVQAHGGQVRVESQAGQGSTFFFTLPRG
ncbi:MAG: PAS domain-containing protein [Verrucomicrobia bacterium]|nr:PAS domain-containing protein [Verrucomicrobiota bacterium]